VIRKAWFAGPGGLELWNATSCAVIIAMSPRFLPYAATPGRALVQATGDFLVVMWLVLWVFVGRLVHDAIAAFAAVGRRVESGGNGIAGNLNSAGNGAGRIPLIGDHLRAPLTAAGGAARDLAGAGHSLDQRATTLAIVLALAVAVPPVLAVAGPWLLLRLRFARRAGAAARLARTPGGYQLLALRALANRPLARVLRAGEDPVASWRAGDPEVIRRLAALELRAVGLK
jgi:hypothetical protein